MSIEPFKRVVVPGKVDVGWEGRPRVVDLWVEIRWQDRNGGMELTISGVEGPKRNGDAWGGCGQVHGSLDQIVTPSLDWTRDMIARLAEIWDRWHLNRMNAGTPAQEAWVREHRAEYPGYPASHLDWARAGLAEVGLEPDDGYSYGSKWLAEDVPDDVVEWLRDLPRGTTAEYPWSLP